MNPSSSETSGIQLPAPVTEQAPAAGVPAESAPAAPEQVPAAGQRAPSAVPSAAAPTTIPLPTPPSLAATPVQSDVSATTQGSSLQIADDGDLIEKAWVDKAKAIVERTREDPYKQNEELTVFKADYMQKRYNKTVKSNK